jgi:hypothetical protein
MGSWILLSLLLIIVILYITVVKIITGKGKKKQLKEFLGSMSRQTSSHCSHRFWFV